MVRRIGALEASYVFPMERQFVWSMLERMKKISDTIMKTSIKENRSMVDILEMTEEAQPAPLTEQKTPAPSSLWQRLALGGVMLISLFMNFYQLGQNGFGNLYYAAGVRSMLDNLNNFFFVSKITIHEKET